MANILVVEDEEDMREVIAYNLRRQGHTVVQSSNGQEALAKLASDIPDLIVSDIMMPEMDGLQFCAAVRARADTALTPFLFVTAKGNVGDKYRGLSAGADDYISKPFELPDLLARVGGRLEHRARLTTLDGEIRATQERIDGNDEPSELRSARAQQQRLIDDLVAAGAPTYQPPSPRIESLRAKVKRFEQRYPALAQRRRTSMVGMSSAFLQIFEEVAIAASSADPTLILGDTGTGKTATAEAIWALSDRADKSFQTVNSAELAAGDPAIALGKLFGYGSGSGLPNVPKDGQPGLLELADAGVLFLDEVAILPTQAQSALLLPLEGRPFHPAVGTGPARTVDVKFVLATNRDLAEEAAEGNFARDLFERIAGETIELPQLCDRVGDIPLLVARFLDELAIGCDPPRELSKEAMQRLTEHDWPGNVRELRRVVRGGYRRAAINERSLIQADDLTIVPNPKSRPAKGRPVDPALVGLFSERERAEIAALRAAGFRIGPAETKLGYSRKSRTLSHRLRGMSLKALSISDWDIDRTARLLGGDNDSTVNAVARRLRTQIDSLRSRAREPTEKLLAHLLAEHRVYAIAAIERLRQG